MAAYPELPEFLIFKDRSEGCDGLLKDFLAVNDEQQIVVLLVFISEALVVKGGYHRFTGTCGSYHEVLEALVYLSLNGQLFEDLLLLGADCVFLQQNFSFTERLLVF